VLETTKPVYFKTHIFPSFKQSQVMRNFSFNQMSDAELFISTGIVVQRCVNNSFLISLSGSLNTVKTAFSIFSDALAAARKEGMDALPDGNTHRTDLIAALANLKKDIAQLLPEDVAAYRHTKSNFDVFNAFLAPINVSLPTHIIVHNAARSGYVRVSWRLAVDGILYLVEHRRQGDTAWKSSGHTTQSLILLSGFEHGAYFEFRLCTLGQDQLRSPWTEPVGIWVA
jgi:hypothetical protein